MNRSAIARLVLALVFVAGLAACDFGEGKDGTTAASPTQAVTAAPTHKPSPVANVPTPCNFLPVRAHDVVAELERPVTAAQYRSGETSEVEGVTVFGETCLYETANPQNGQRLIVAVAWVMDDANHAFWNGYVTSKPSLITADLADEAVTSVGTAKPEVAFRLRQFTVRVYLVDEPGTPEGRDLVMRLAKIAVRNIQNR